MASTRLDISFSHVFREANKVDDASGSVKEALQLQEDFCVFYDIPDCIFYLF